MKAELMQIIEKYEIIFIGLLTLFCIICIQYSTLNFIQKGALTVSVSIAFIAFLFLAYAIEKQKKARKNETE